MNLTPGTPGFGLLAGTRSPRLAYRRLQAEDSMAWRAFFNDPESRKYWQGAPATPEASWQALYGRNLERYRSGLGGMNALICLKTGQLQGMCGITRQEVDGRMEWELGYALFPEARGKGLATEAALHCRDTALQQGWATRLISIIAVENTPSIQVARRLGMQLETQTIFKGNPVGVFCYHAKA
ncbi:GNAT family N-acetyltransferase [Robiginitalea sp. M366]|uniref:GNAT family N-acetyltransferase n=1 Tax=Robiginitalea aestuariiviva TaxID=3036903 RepID=UPI00240D80A3|nr:GNAT family N-acetyltransferase [Robiginitalea aestuariiviva]MDG1572215.1 GNAT family N-acetyltransferase [Robiginitalea aestuariiviva]